MASATVENVLATLAEALDGTVHSVGVELKDITGTGRVAFAGLPMGQKLGDVGPYVTGTVEDRSVTVEFEPMGRMAVKCQCWGSHRFRVAPSSFLSRLDILSGRRVRLGTAFDDRFVVRGSGVEAFTKWLSSEEVRDLLISLAPMVHLILERGLLKYRAVADVDRLDPSAVLDAVASLCALATSAEALSEVPLQDRDPL